jgi:cobaltochelatase CobS
VSYETGLPYISIGVPMSTPTTSLDDFVASAMADYMKQNIATATTVAPVAPTPAVETPPTPVKEVLKNGFCKMFSCAVPESMSDFAVDMFADVPESVSYHIPKEDEHYVLQVEEAARLVAAMMDNDKVLMTGPTGSGKSSLVKYVCAKMGAPFIRVNMSADVESSALFGQLVVRDGATVWVDGPVTEAVRYGCVLLIDEWELMPPEISMGLQNLLEDDGYLFLKEMPGTSVEKTIVPHKNFRIVCGGNTVGQGDDTGGFSGTMVQNSATLDRFTTTIHLNYLSAKHEEAIITKRTGVADKLAKQMVKLAHLIRSAYGQQQINLTMSPRTLINWAQKSKRHDNTSLAFRIAFYDKLRDSDKKAVAECFGKVFTEKL